MKEKFDDLVKARFEMSTDIPEVPFNEEKVWRKINERLPGKSSGGIKSYILFGSIVLVSFFWFGLRNKSGEEPHLDKMKSQDPIENISETEFLNNNLDGDTSEQATEIKSISKENVGYKHPEQSNKLNDTVPKKAILGPLKVSKEEPSKMETATLNELKILQKAVVNIYRPRRFTGSGLVFKLKANGKIIQKVKNGKRYTVLLTGGTTQFTVGKKTIYVDLKPGEIYYIKVPSEGFPIGRPGLALVPKEEAKIDWE